MTPEQIEQEWSQHELCTHAPIANCSCGESGEYPWATREQAHRAHRFAAIASLMPQATETVEYKPSDDDRDAWVSSTPWADHDLHPGEVCLRRTVTSYAPVVGEWEAVDA